MIILKGSPKGISVSVDDTDFETGRAELIEKLSASKEFFKDIAATPLPKRRFICVSPRRARPCAKQMLRSLKQNRK